MHLYGIDCGNGALLPLADLPHCGAVVTRTQAERAARLLARLGAELARRQDLLAEGGFAGITEQRAAAGPRRPAAAHRGAAGPVGRVHHHARRGRRRRPDRRRSPGSSREGASAGIHLIMTGDRSLLAGRIAAMCEDKLVFKLAEPDDYALAGLRPRDLPADIPPGRAFRAGTGTETQVALLDPDPSGQAQAAALRQTRRLGGRPGRRGAPPGCARSGSTCLPSRITFDAGLAAAPARRGPPAVGPGRRGRRRADRRSARTCPRASRRSSWPARPGPAAPRSWPR